MTDSVNVAFNDSVDCELLVANNNLFSDFKFVTEQSTDFSGPIEREVSYVASTWNFVVLLVIMFLMILNKFLAQQKLVSVISMPFQNVGNDKMTRDGQSFFNTITLSAIISFILLISLFVQKLYVIYGGNHILHDNLGFYCDVVICVTAAFVFNYLLTLFYGWMFNSEALISLHFGFYVSAMMSCNVFLMPLILILLFHPYKFILIFVITIMALVFIITFIKLLIEVRMLSKLNFVNIFLYLCTIEILPILVISKLIVNII